MFYFKWKYFIIALFILNGLWFFVTLDLNFLEWTPDKRFFYVLSILLPSFWIGFFPSEYDNTIKKTKEAKKVLMELELKEFEREIEKMFKEK